MADTSRTRLGQYELLLPPVGEGSEGLLYKARVADRSGAPSGEYVAVKRLRHIGREVRSDRFQRQAELLRKLDHPGIVRYKDSFVWRDEDSDESPEVYCLVTEWLEGRSLKDLLEQNLAGVPWETAEGILRQVLEALVYASTQRVIHRDLKPSNIYMLQEGKVKLIDFGIARPIDAEATTTNTSSSFEGTWNWMAPDFIRLQEESFRGDERSDIYSFGVCFYQLLTGKFPYGAVGENPQFAYFQRWLAPTAPKLIHHPNLNALKGARSFVQKCLDAERDKRFQTFEELLEAFGKIRYRQLRHGSEIYEYRGYLGQGGFGQVYRACRLSDGRQVALKELVAGQHARRFVREAKILQKAPHPHLVEYLDFVEVQASHVGDDSRYFLVLEYLEGMPGSSLRERIKVPNKPIDPRELLVLFSGYLDCLEHLHQHEHRIIHRDIKPGNLYAPAGSPEKGKLFDLGIAHDEEGTRTHGQVPGTLDYMPPEFASPECGRGSPQSDVYSLAVTLYEALTKSLPFPRLPPGEKAWVEYISRSLKPTECSFENRVFAQYPELVGLLRSALANDPQLRFPSARAMQDEIHKILDKWDRVNLAVATALTAARSALQRQDWEAIEKHVHEALESRPNDSEAVKLLETARYRRQELLDQAILSARVAAGRKDYAEAERQARAALAIQADSAEAKELLLQYQQSKEALRQSGLAQAPGALTIRLPEETQPGPPGPAFPDDPLTASTARGTSVPGRQRTGQTTFISRSEDRSSAAPSTDWDSSPKPQPLPSRWAGWRRWAYSVAFCAVLLLSWAGWRFLSGDSQARISTDAEGLSPAYLRTRLPELLASAAVQADPALKRILRSVSSTKTPTTQDLLALQTGLAQWWSDVDFPSTEMAHLPLGRDLEGRVRQERLNQVFPGPARALQVLDEMSRSRQMTGSNWTRLVADWKALDNRISSSPDLELWHGFVSDPGFVQNLLKRDFEQLLQSALSGAGAGWTPAQYVPAFFATIEQVQSRLGLHYYRPPATLHSLLQYKGDQSQPAELRDFASESLSSEIQAVEALVQGHSDDSFSTWKTRLDRYRSVAPGQVSGLPSPADLSALESNFSDCAAALAKAASDANSDAARSRLQQLKKRFESLRIQIQNLIRAASRGLVSQERLGASGNDLTRTYAEIAKSVNELAGQTLPKASQGQ